MNDPTNITVFLLLSTVCMAGCGTNRFQQEVQTEEAAVKLANETVDGQYQLVTTAEVKKMLDAGDDLLLVDAMPAEDSYNKGHLAGAVNYVFPKEAMDGWNEDAMDGQTQEDYEQLLGQDKDRKIVVYCGFVKCARSHNAAVCARELGYTNVYRYPGGIHAWRGAGYGLETN